MPFISPTKGRVWGEGVFENDGAMVAVAYLDELTGIAQVKVIQSSTILDGIGQLKMIEPSAMENKEHRGKSTEPVTKDGINHPQADSPSGTGDVTYSVYSRKCSTPEAAQKVRDHLDSGVLQTIARKLVANFHDPIAASDYTCHGYVPIILGACAMSLGCSTLYTIPGCTQFRPSFKVMMLGILPYAPLMFGARSQISRALGNHGGFKPGTPIDFANYAHPPEDVSDAQPDAHVDVMIGGVYKGYTGVVELKNALEVSASPMTKADVGYGPNEKVCGGCEIETVKALVCSRCKDQIYCSTACQRKDFRRHKHVCRLPEDAKAMDEFPEEWRNRFVVSLPNVKPEVILSKSVAVSKD